MILHRIMYLAAAIPLGYAVYSDCRSRTIPLWTTLSILALAGLQYILGLQPIRMLIGGTILGAAFFAAAIISPDAVGGGDVKLLAALSILCGAVGGLIVFAAAAFFTLLLWLVIRQKRLPFAPGIFAAFVLFLVITFKGG